MTCGHENVYEANVESGNLWDPLAHLSQIETLQLQNKPL